MAEDLTKTMLVAEAALRQYDSIMKAIKTPSAIEALNRAAFPTSSAIEALKRAIAPTSSAVNLVDDKLRQQMTNFVKQADLIGSTFRPTDLGVMPDLKAIQLAVGNFNARFELPKLAEIEGLIEQFKTVKFSSETFRLDQLGYDFQVAMEAMRTPWLDTVDKLKSINGFAELQGIGLALQAPSAFSDGIARQLRAALGDWRDTIKWPENIFDDTLARTAFYADKGLHSRLTDFPADAFHESLEIAGLAVAPPPLLKTYDGTSDPNDQEAGFRRNNAAHDRLQRFETQIRKFIDEKMTVVFGANWMKHRVPEVMRERWREKKETARKNGEQDRPLIAYSDFTDYVTLITRNDNWIAIFKPVFQRVEFVTESFQRLYPIRICTMHARIITPDDELYLHVETKRVLAAIGIVS